jgi:hypothetical protein
VLKCAQVVLDLRSSGHASGHGAPRRRSPRHGLTNEDVLRRQAGRDSLGNPRGSRSRGGIGAAGHDREILAGVLGYVLAAVHGLNQLTRGGSQPSRATAGRALASWRKEERRVGVATADVRPDSRPPSQRTLGGGDAGCLGHTSADHHAAAVLRQRQGRYRASRRTLGRR